MANFFDEDSGASINPETGRVRITVTPTRPAKNFFDEEGPTDRVSTPEAIARGAGSGATFGFLPRIAGGLAAAGAAEAGGLAGMDIDPYAVGQQVTQEQRARQKAAREQHPYAYGGAEFAGGAAVPLPGGALMGAGRPVAQRMLGGALQGALGGGLAGAGEAETVGQMPGAAGRGALMGGVLGGPLGAVAPAISHYVTAPVRSVLAPGSQAERLIAETYARARNIPVLDWMGRPTRFVPGQPNVPPEAVIADYLGKPGRRLARWSGNVSSEAQSGLENVVSTRMEQQGQRLRNFVQQRWGVSENDLDRQRVRAEAARQNDPLYQLAMWHGNQLPYSPQLEALRQAPAIQTAIAGAQTSLQNRAIGQGGRSGAPAGAPTTGQLAYWDQVKRGLDSQIGRAERAGDREQMNELIPLKQRLTDTLDTLVPEYANARGNARMYFGRENAIEAGAHAINNPSLSWRGVERSYNAMTPEERQLFQQAGRNEFIAKTENVANRFDLWKRIDQNENEKQKMKLFFGDQGYRELEAMHHAENIMSWLSNAVKGGSNTAEQMIATGALGAAGGYSYGDVGGGFSGTAMSLLPWLSKRAGRAVNEKVAERVGQMLTSSDPQMLSRVLAAARRSDSFMQTLRDLGNAAMARGTGAELGQREQRQQQGEL
jgi:hypothetical protein